MLLTRTWLRGSLQALGALLLLPAGVVLALVLTASGGSLGGLSSLGQVFEGPAVPVLGATPLSAGGRAAHHAASLPVVPLPSPLPTAGGSSVGGSRGSSRSRSGVVGRGPALSGGGQPQPTGPGSGGAGGGGGSGGGGAGGSGGSGGSAGSAQPAPGSGSNQGSPPTPANPVRQVGQAAGQAAGNLPAPVGKAGSDAVGTVVNLVSPAGP